MKGSVIVSIFLPYSIDLVINYFATKFSIDLTTLTVYEQLSITIFANIYFFVYWFFVIYIALKIFNRIWERVF